MRIALQKELLNLKNLILDMAKMVNDMVNEAVSAIEDFRVDVAERVIKSDEQVNYYEKIISEKVLEIIALQQPVAKDLRFVITAIDIARNLERIGDQAVNIAYYIKDLEKKTQKGHFCKVSILEMAQEALFMLQSAINAFVEENSAKAKRVIEYDDVVDKLQNENILQIKNCMEENPQFISEGIELIGIVKNLERIADLSTNIAEGVIFTLEGIHPKFELEKYKALKIIEETILKEVPVFELLKKHARLVRECITRIPLALEAYLEKNQERLNEISSHIFEIEKEADKLKQNIRGHLPKGIVLPVEKFELFLYLKEQDAIADSAEEVLNWLSFKHVSEIKEIFPQIQSLIEESVEIVDAIEPMIVFSSDFLLRRNEETRNKAKEIIRNIRYKQFVAESRGNDLKKEIFKKFENPLVVFYLLNLVDRVLGIYHHTENTADLMRAMIAK